jgi:hypothetical protein
MALEREVETYRRKLSELLADKGRFVLIFGEEVEGIFDTHDAAIEAGYSRHLNDAFLVRLIAEKEPVAYTTRNLRPCPTPPSPSTNTVQ